VSLILEALRKLEREKDVREPGVLVVGSVPWGGGRSRLSLVLLLAASIVVALTAAGSWLLRRPTPARIEPPGRAPAPSAAEAPSPPAATAGGAPPASPAAAPAPRRLDVPSGASPSGGAPTAASTETSARRLSPGGIRLTAISRRDGRPVALINDRLAFEGDSFDGIKVLRIGETEVEVEVGGRRLVLRF